MGEISVKTGNNARNGGKNSLNRLIRCVCGKKIGPDPRNFNQRVSLGRNDLLIRTFLNTQQGSVALPVELTNCADETGALIIQGQSASSDPSKQLFTAATGDTVGFMIKDANDVQVAESQNVALDVTSADTNSYSFNVGMGTTDATPAAGSYSVPVTVAYIVN
ncbi:hypothetical protein [Klebsiella pneumoniae]|uniref:hypothetical protein n=1 Tax=Klebsiella pneumoniae TaxID=573 RepID=UPI00216435E0|nr:hypothetical protein [Klebsiella pneumoniae]